MKIPTITTQTELDAWFAEIGKDPYAQSKVTQVLDEMVNEVKSREAADINNSGIDAQVGFLLDTDENDITGLWRDLRDALEEDE